MQRQIQTGRPGQCPDCLPFERIPSRLLLKFRLKFDRTNGVPSRNSLAFALVPGSPELSFQKTTPTPFQILVGGMGGIGSEIAVCIFRVGIAVWPRGRGDAMVGPGRQGLWGARNRCQGQAWLFTWRRAHRQRRCSASAALPSPSLLVATVAVDPVPTHSVPFCVNTRALRGNPRHPFPRLVSPLK